MVSVLGLVEPMNLIGPEEDDTGVGTTFEPLSPGVLMITNYYHRYYSAPFQLGSTQFGCYDPTLNATDFQGASDCQGEFTSSYMPADGTYQLLFGSFGHVGATPVAVAVKSVSVPEEESLAYVAIGFLAMPLLCRLTPETNSCSFSVRVGLDGKGA